MSIGPYRVGTIPTGVVTIDVTRGGTDADLSVYDAVTAELVRPSGFSDLLEVEIIGSDAYVRFPRDRSLFTYRGVYRLLLTFENRTTGTREQGDAVPFPVEAEDGWHTVASARAEWPQGPKDDLTFFRLLTVAREQVEAFGNSSPSPIPEGWRMAQRAHARNIFNATASSARTDGGIAGEGTSFRPHPMDWWIKQLVRPERGGFGGAA